MAFEVVQFSGDIAETLFNMEGDTFSVRLEIPIDGDPIILVDRW